MKCDNDISFGLQRQDLYEKRNKVIPSSRTKLLFSKEYGGVGETIIFLSYFTEVEQTATH